MERFTMLRALRPTLRFVGSAVLLFSLVEVLGGSSCSVSSCSGCDDDWDDDDFDDDDSWDDDDDGSSSAVDPQRDANTVVDWQLRHFRRIPASEPGRHAYRSLIDIRGFSLSSKLGPGVFGDAELRSFTAQVIGANGGLFGLPEDAGQLRFDAIDHRKNVVVVTYVQELVDRERGVTTLVPDAELAFVLDLRGRLVEVDDTLRVAPGR